MREAIQPNLLYSMVCTHGIYHHHMLYSTQYITCYILWYIACSGYITCCVQAGLQDPPLIENQWCYIAGYIPQYITRAILSAIQHMVMLYSTCIYHAIQQIKLYSFPHVQHICYIAHILCYIAHTYTMVYSLLGYIASLIYGILLYSTYFIGMSQPSGYDIALEPFGCQFQPCRAAPSWCGLRRCLELLG